MVPAEFRQSGLKSYTEGGATWADAARAFREDEFILDPTRLTLSAGPPATTARSSRTCSPPSTRSS